MQSPRKRVVHLVCLGRSSTLRGLLEGTAAPHVTFFHYAVRSLLRFSLTTLPYLALISAKIAPPSSRVVAAPPMSAVRTRPFANAFAIALSTASAASISPQCRSIIAPDQ